MRRWALVLASVSAVVVASPAWAWGDQGHEIIGALALNLMQPATRDKVQAILNADTDTLTGTDIASRATWADKFRDSDRPPQGVKATPQKNPRYLGTRQWHFVDIPLGTTDLAFAQALAQQCPHPTLTTKASLGAPETDCVVDKISQFKSELRRSADPAERLLALKFILHYVGDVHQPLHAVDDNDQGGNCLYVAGPQGGAIKLHAYWDSNVVKDIQGHLTQSDLVSALNGEITSANRKSWSSKDPAVWARESFGIAKTVGYALGAPPTATCAVDNQQSPMVLPHDYRTNADKAARTQLKKAAYRLAITLDDALAN